MSISTVSEEKIIEEHALVEAAQKDPAAFKPFYDRYYPVIFRYIFNKVRDKETTAELTSQVFLSAMLKLSSYTFKGVPFSAWLYRIAGNEAGQYFRKANKIPYVSIGEDVWQEISDANSDICQEYLHAQIEDAMQKLNPEEIQLIELRFQEAKSFQEIGFILNITENNAKVRTYRLLDKIRKLMETANPEPKTKNTSFLKQLRIAAFALLF